MEYNFVNGTADQRQQWAQAAHLLLNMPFEDIDLSVEVEFTDLSEVVAHGHNDLALTFFSYDSTSARQAVRNDAPSFGTQQPAMEALAASLGLPYDSTRFYLETSAHELGHAAFAALPEQRRLAVCRLFGVNTDDIAVIEDKSKPWEDRVIEGIAETFKEAFLPARHRVFPNRTRRRIPYAKYPNFRSIFRGGSGSGGGGFSYVYGNEYPWSVDLTEWGIILPTYQGERDDEAFVFYEEIEGYKDCWGVDMSQFKESSHKPFSISTAGIITS